MAIFFLSLWTSIWFDLLFDSLICTLSLTIEFRNSRYSSIPLGKSLRVPFPSNPTNLSQVRSKKYRSCEITTSVPAKLSNKSSSAVKVSTSKSLGGSSKSKTLELRINNRVNCNLHFSLRDKFLTVVCCPRNKTQVARTVEMPTLLSYRQVQPYEQFFRSTHNNECGLFRFIKSLNLLTNLIL